MRRSGALLTGALLIAALTAGGSGAVAAATAITPAGTAGPARGITYGPRISNRVAQSTSRNWAGYATYAATDSTDFNAVEATWVQPTVKCEAVQAWTVFWVGLDGWTNGTVEQGGSSAFCPSKGGAAQYRLWWEMFPTNSIQTTLTIAAGDEVTASVTYAKATKVFAIKVRDVTSGHGFTKNEKCASGQTCARSSAEVITEDVGRFGAGDYFPLANYGTMGYTGVGVTDINGHAGSLGDSHWVHSAVTESSGGVTYATVSALHKNGTAFTTTWHHK